MRSRLLLFIGTLLCSTLAFADYPPYGISFSHTVIPKDPTNTQAYRAALWYQPKSFIWQHVHVLFDVSYGHWWVPGHHPHHSLNIVSASPLLRYYFKSEASFSPFINISLGVAYLSHTRFDDRNLGMHFSFQDQLGIGVTVGQKHKFSIVLNAIHYSNGSLCNMNAGITIPLMMTAEYGFG